MFRKMERFYVVLLGIYILFSAFINSSKSQQICPSPNFPENGDYSPKPAVFQFGEAITYSCDRGYILVGEEASKCKSDGTWSQPTPFCDPKAILKNLYARPITGNQHHSLEVADANCSTCYPFRKSETIEVNLDKNTVVSAVRLYLGAGDTSIEISTGRTRCGDHYKNHLVTSQWIVIYCKNNAESTNTVRIQDKSDTVNVSAICEIEVYVRKDDECENPTDKKIANGYFQVSRSKAELICQEGYRSNSTRLVCEDKKWKGHILPCIEILCNPKTNITRPRGGDWIFLDPVEKISAGTKRQLICGLGYTRTGKPDIIVCQKNGTWTRTNATCEQLPKDNTRTIIYIAVGVAVALIIIALLGAIIYFVRRQRDRQVVVIYKSPPEGSVISGSDGDSTAPHYETIQNIAPVAVAPRPLPQILSDGYALPLHGKDTSKTNTMPADIAFSSFKQSALYY